MSAHHKAPEEAVPVTSGFIAATTAELARLYFEQGHHQTTAAGRTALCAMALAVVVRVAARIPQGSPERRALAGAARALRQVV